MTLEKFLKENMRLSKNQILLKFGLTNESWGKNTKEEILKSLHYFKFEMQKEEPEVSFFEIIISKIRCYLINFKK